MLRCKDSGSLSKGFWVGFLSARLAHAQKETSQVSSQKETASRELLPIPALNRSLCVFYHQVLLKTDSSWLMRSESSREKPTIPCFLLFVIHVQQQELGGFTLPSDMYKWTKMR